MASIIEFLCSSVRLLPQTWPFRVFPIQKRETKRSHRGQFLRSHSRRAARQERSGSFAVVMVFLSFPAEAGRLVLPSDFCDFLEGIPKEGMDFLAYFLTG